MNIITTIGRVLTFRITREEMLGFSPKHFLTGLTGTWLVGMGRYWDNPRASLLQHLGIGSVIYIFCLSLFIWLIVLPFRVEKWTYPAVVIFISLTSFPAVLYAIPVEKWFDIETANIINAWFLILVAAWRLAQLYFFLNRFTKLRPGYILTITLLPVCLIIVTLTMLNLERAVFDMMGGFTSRTGHEGAYMVLTVLSFFSIILVIPLLLAYIIGVVRRGREQD